MEKGYYLFKLEDLLNKKGISFNRLMSDTNTDFKTIKRLCTGDTTRIDLTVLARFCTYLNCEVSDIVEFKRK